MLWALRWCWTVDFHSPCAEMMLRSWWWEGLCSRPLPTCQSSLWPRISVTESDGSAARGNMITDQPLRMKHRSVSSSTHVYINMCWVQVCLRLRVSGRLCVVREAVFSCCGSAAWSRGKHVLQWHTHRLTHCCCSLWRLIRRRNDLTAPCDGMYWLVIGGLH